MTSKAKHKVLLVILDGWGIRKERESNAILLAGTPQLDKLAHDAAFTELQTSGLAVGLPDGQMGNSEVGHTNIGAGRIVYQDLTRINKAIRDLTERVRKVAEEREVYKTGATVAGELPIPKDEIVKLVKELEKQMKQAAKDLEFEKAASLRDQVIELRRTLALEAEVV